MLAVHVVAEPSEPSAASPWLHSPPRTDATSYRWAARRCSGFSGCHSSDDAEGAWPIEADAGSARWTRSVGHELAAVPNGDENNPTATRLEGAARTSRRLGAERDAP